MNEKLFHHVDKQNLKKASEMQGISTLRYFQHSAKKASEQPDLTYLEQGVELHKLHLGVHAKIIIFNDSTNVTS